MTQRQAGFKKTFNQNIPTLKSVWDEHRPGFYLFSKAIWVFNSNKIKKKNKTLKKFNKNSIKKFKNFFKPLFIVYIILIKHKNFKKMQFTLKFFAKKTSYLYEKHRLLKKNTTCFISPKKT